MARTDSRMVWIIILVLIILWFGGFTMHVGGSLIHILLVIILILVIWRLATGRSPL